MRYPFFWKYTDDPTSEVFCQISENQRIAVGCNSVCWIQIEGMGPGDNREKISKDDFLIAFNKAKFGIDKATEALKTLGLQK